jgi:hypothetical protein
MLAVAVGDCQQRGAKNARWIGLQEEWGAPGGIQGRPKVAAKKTDAHKKGAHPGENARPGSTLSGRAAQSANPDFLSPGHGAGMNIHVVGPSMVALTRFVKMPIAGEIASYNSHP